jgi:hypothetical protein
MCPPGHDPGSPAYRAGILNRLKYGHRQPARVLIPATKILEISVCAGTQARISPISYSVFNRPPDRTQRSRQTRPQTGSPPDPPPPIHLSQVKLASSVSWSQGSVETDPRSSCWLVSSGPYSRRLPTCNPDCPSTRSKLLLAPKGQKRKEPPRTLRGGSDRPGCSASAHGPATPAVPQSRK